MADLPWFRYYSETKSDVKFSKIARMCHMSKTEVVGAWTFILCAASESPDRGKLYVTFQERYTVVDVTELLCFTETKTKVFLLALIKMEMLECHKGVFMVSNWDKRQYQSDNSTSRVKKFREKQAVKRLGNVSVTPSDTDTDTDINSAKSKRKPRSTSAPKPPKPFMDNPMVTICRDTVKITPNEEQRKVISEKIIDPVLWKSVCMDWMFHGYKPTNIPGMIDAYLAGGLQSPSNGFKQQPAKTQRLPDGL